MAVWLEAADGNRFPIVGSCSIGRSSSNAVVLKDERVSRRHAILHSQNEGQFWLVDLGSANGTYLNGRRVSQPTILRSGDRIQIAAAVFRFQNLGAIEDTQGTQQRTVLNLRSQNCWLLIADIVASTQLVRSLPHDELSMVTGRWFQICDEIISSNGGVINQFLGDGFFAFWPANPAPAAPAKALAALKELQKSGKPAFRIAMHFGSVYLGGVATKGEENLSGGEMHFIFRMEKMAAPLGIDCLLSEPAQSQFGNLVASSPVGEHAVSGFEGKHRFYRA